MVKPGEKLGHSNQIYFLLRIFSLFVSVEYRQHFLLDIDTRPGTGSRKFKTIEKTKAAKIPCS
jgi:hypothetical protein